MATLYQEMVVLLLFTLLLLRSSACITREAYHGSVALRVVLTLMLFPPFWPDLSGLRDDWRSLDCVHI